MRTKRERLEAAAPVPAVETALVGRAPRARRILHLPAAAKRAERLLAAEDVDARAVIRHAHRVDAAQRVLHKVHPHLARVRVECVPHEFLDR